MAMEMDWCRWHAVCRPGLASAVATLLHRSPRQTPLQQSALDAQQWIDTPEPEMVALLCNGHYCARLLGTGAKLGLKQFVLVLGTVLKQLGLE